METHIILTAEQVGTPPVSNASIPTEQNDPTVKTAATLIAEEFATLVSAHPLASPGPVAVSTSLLATPDTTSPPQESATEDTTPSSPPQAEIAPEIHETIAALQPNALLPIKPVIQGQLSPPAQETSHLTNLDDPIISYAKAVTANNFSLTGPSLTAHQNGVVPATLDQALSHSSPVAGNINNSVNLLAEASPEDTLTPGKPSFQVETIATPPTGNTGNSPLTKGIIETPSVSLAQLAIPPDGSTIEDKKVLLAPADKNALAQLSTQPALALNLSAQGSGPSDILSTALITPQAPSSSLANIASVPQVSVVGTTPPAIQQVVLAIQTQPQTSSGDIEVRLDPPELGNVRIKFQFDIQGQIQAHIFAENSDTTTLLRRHIDILARELADNGFHSADIQFDKNNENLSQENEQKQEQKLGLVAISSEDSTTGSLLNSNHLQTPYKSVASSSHLNIIL